MGADPIEAARAVDAADGNVTELPRRRASDLVEARLDTHAALVLRAHIASGYADYRITIAPSARPIFTPDLWMRLEAAFRALGVMPEGEGA